MQQTQNYNLLIPEGTDVVNPLTQVNPNFQTIDSAMFANKQATIGTASEVVTGTVHAIIRNNADSNVFRFTATGAWTAGDTMTLDGQQVTVHLSDGTTPATNSYIIGAEVLAMVNGSLVTLAISTTPPAQGVTSFNSRTGAVVPQSSDYDASMVDYDNTLSGLTATDTQAAIDELQTEIKNIPTGGSVNYSTIEQEIGTWIDGSKLYELTINCGALPNNNLKTIDETIANIKDVVYTYGIAIASAGSQPLPTSNPQNIGYAIALSTAMPSAGTVRVNIRTASDFSSYTGYVTIRYTKSV